MIASEWTKACFYQFLRQVNPFNGNGTLVPATAAYLDGFVPYLNPFENAGIYGACDSGYIWSQTSGVIVRELMTWIGGGGSVAYARGLGLGKGVTKLDKLVAGEFGPGLVGLTKSLVLGQDPFTKTALMTDYVVKTILRIDTALTIRDAVGGENE